MKHLLFKSAVVQSDTLRVGQEIDEEGHLFFSTESSDANRLPVWLTDVQGLALRDHLDFLYGDRPNPAYTLADEAS